MIDKKAIGSNACSFFMAVQFLRFNHLSKTLNFVMIKFNEFGTAYSVIAVQLISAVSLYVSRNEAFLFL